MEEVTAFYANMGHLLCIAYVLGSRDLHYENLIACGSSPVLIDLETLFHVPVNQKELNKQEPTIREALALIQDSVMQTALLPTLLTNPQTGQSMEIGAMGTGTRQRSPYLTFTLNGLGTDQVRAEACHRWKSGGMG